MKFTIAIALIGLASGVMIRDDSPDVSDLFNENADEAETLKSIAEAEKATGTKMDKSLAQSTKKDYDFAGEHADFQGASQINSKILDAVDGEFIGVPINTKEIEIAAAKVQ